jgi:hypothetical protein
MLACMGASAGTIVASNQQAVETWKYGPAVLLALYSSIWSIAAFVTLGIGVTVTWWRSALRGTTLENQHYIWDKGRGMNPLAALRAGSDARKVTLIVWLVGSVQIINGPLLQRSTFVTTEDTVWEETRSLDMKQQLPEGWLGKVWNAASADIIGSPNGISAIQGWWKNTTIWTKDQPGYYCDGTCEGAVQGTGITYQCDSTTLALDLLAEENYGSSIFGINTTLSRNSTGEPVLVLTTLYSSSVNNSCIASIVLDTCRIEAAKVNYPILIQNTTVTLDKDKLPNMTTVSKYVSPGDSLDAQKNQGAGPLLGLNDFIGGYLVADATLQITSQKTCTYVANGTESLFPDLFFISDSSKYDTSILHKCNLEWSSPTEYVLEFIHDFLFRSSLLASTDNDTQTFIVQRTNTLLIFQSNLGYLAGALAAMLLALFAMLALLWRCWELGRQVSLSPLETAKAFGALQHTGDNSAVDGILKTYGTTEISYDGAHFSFKAAEFAKEGEIGCYSDV